MASIAIDGQAGVFPYCFSWTRERYGSGSTARGSRACRIPGNAAVRRNSAESHVPKSENAISLSAPSPAEPEPASPGAIKSLSPEATKTDENNRQVARQAYLEFSATSPQTAGIIADALHEKGFEAIASETEDPPGASMC